jgi:hypothetical protein
MNIDKTFGAGMVAGIVTALAIQAGLTLDLADGAAERRAALNAVKAAFAADLRARSALDEFMTAQLKDKRDAAVNAAEAGDRAFTQYEAAFEALEIPAEALDAQGKASFRSFRRQRSDYGN